MAKMGSSSAESSSFSTFDSNISLHYAPSNISPTPTHMQHDPHNLSTQAQPHSTFELRTSAKDARRTTHPPSRRRRAHRTCLLGSVVVRCFRIFTAVAAHCLSFLRITVNAFPAVQEHRWIRHSRKSIAGRRDLEEDDDDWEANEDDEVDEGVPSSQKGSSKYGNPPKDVNNTGGPDEEPVEDDDELEDDEEAEDEDDPAEPEDEDDPAEPEDDDALPSRPRDSSIPGNEKEHPPSRNPKKLPSSGIAVSTIHQEGTVSHSQQPIYTHTASTDHLLTSKTTFTFFTSLRPSPSVSALPTISPTVSTVPTISPVFQDQSVDSKDNGNNDVNSDDSSHSISSHSSLSRPPTESLPANEIASSSGPGGPTPTQGTSDNSTLSLLLSTNIVPLTMVAAFITFLVISAVLYRRRNRQRIRVATTSKSPTLKGPTPSLDPISPSSHSPSPPPPPPSIPLSFPVVISIPSTTQVHLQPTRTALPPLGGPGPRIKLPSSRRLALQVISEEEFDEENEESSEHEANVVEIVAAVTKKESLRRKRSKGKGHVRKTSQRLDGDELRLVLRK
ncbi:hypothetical protein BJ742DRAFT_860025 [Cladochytrium replicatum]|nr:hypothetical protein BJ742DRAFT_860025 [Cladochytrium replicatum]